MEPNLPPRLPPNLPGSKPGASLPWDAGGGILPYLSAPAKVTAPVIAGSLATGGVITLTSLGTWSSGTARPQTFTYQVQRGGVDIGGATGTVTTGQLPLAIWTAVAADSAVALTVIVTATNIIGSTASDASNGITITLPELWQGRTESSGNVGDPIGTRNNEGTAGGSFTAAGAARRSIALANGIKVPDYDGSANTMASALTLNDVVTVGEHHFLCVVDIDSLAADAGLSLNPSVFVASVAPYLFVEVYTNTIRCVLYTTGNVSISAPIATGGLKLVEFWHTGGNIHLRVGSAAEVTPVACGNIGSVANTLRTGANYNATAFFNGRIAEQICAKTYSAQQSTDLRTYLAARWGVAA